MSDVLFTDSQYGIVSKDYYIGYQLRLQCYLFAKPEAKEETDPGKQGRFLYYELNCAIYKR